MWVLASYWGYLPNWQGIGGAPASFAYHASVLGGEGLMVSCMGSAYLGDEILERLSTLSLPYKYVTRDTEHPAGTVSVKVGAEGNPSFLKV